MTGKVPGRLPSPAFWASRRVLVTGHTGFKGSWLTAWLTEMGADVAGLSLPEPPTSPSLWEVLGATLPLDIRADICGDGWQTAVTDFDPQVIIHLAAQPLVAEGYRSALRTFQTNVIGTARVLDVTPSVASLESVLVATTDKVYDATGQPPYVEASRLGGADPYSASKVCAEMVVHSWPELPAPVVTARAGNVVGGGDWGDHRLVPDLVRGWSAGSTPDIRRPSAVRPWQHVLEPLGGYLVYLERLTEVGDLPRSMNFGPSAGQAVAVGEVVRHAAEAWATEFALDHAPAFAERTAPTMHETANLLIDSSQATSLLGWTGHLDWKTAISMSIAWYASYLRGEDAPSLLRTQLREYASSNVGVTR
jgi:CDP-glucose 4,6-dehydratase